MGTMMVTLENCNHGNVSFKCVTSEGCINLTLLCDGVNHCPDGSDESFTHARCYDVYKSSPSTALIEMIAIILGCLVALAILCCVLGTIVECARHIYKYWCPKRLHVALQRRRTQPINRFSSGSRVERADGDLSAEPRDQRSRPLETSLVYSPRLRTIDYTRACLPLAQGTSNHHSVLNEGRLLMDRSAAVVMYLNQLPPQYSAVVLSPTSTGVESSATRTTVLSNRSPHVDGHHQQQQLLWLKQQHRQSVKEQNAQNSAYAQTNMPERNIPSGIPSAAQSMDGKLKTNRQQTTGYPEGRTDGRLRCAAAKPTSSSGDPQSRDCDPVANDSSITFSNFARSTAAAALKRRVKVSDATTSTTVDDIIFDDDRSIYCTRAALENLLKTGNYIACHVIPSCTDSAVAKEGDYSEVNIIENPYQVVKSEYTLSDQKEKANKVGVAEGGSILNQNGGECSSRIEKVITDDDEDDYDEADYQQMKSCIFGKHSASRKEAPLKGIESGASSSESTPSPTLHSNPGVKDPLTCSSKTAQLIPESTTFQPIPKLPGNSDLYSPPPTTNLSPVLSPQSSYPIVLIQALSPVRPINNQIESFLGQSDTRDLTALRLNNSDVTNGERGNSMPPSYSSVHRANQRRD